MKSFLEKYAYTHMDYDKMEGTVPDADVEYVIRIVNAESQSDAIKEDDIVNAVGTWEALQGDQEKIKAKFDEFDKDNTGTLSPDQVAQMLKWMNGGEQVSQEEVDWVIAQADVSGEGSLRKDEINAAVAVWYTKVTEDAKKKSSVCGIL